MTRILSSPLIRECFHRGFVEALFRSHRDQKRFNGFKIWNLSFPRNFVFQG